MLTCLLSFLNIKGFAYESGVVGGHYWLLYRDVYPWRTVVHAGRAERYRSRSDVNAIYHQNKEETAAA